MGSERGGQDSAAVLPGGLGPQPRIELAAGRDHQIAALLDVLAQQRHGRRRAPTRRPRPPAGRPPTVPACSSSIFTCRTSISRRSRSARLVTGRQQPAEIERFAIAVQPRGLVAAPLVHEHHRQGRQHGHHQKTPIVGRKPVGRERNLGGDEGRLARLDRHVEMVRRKANLPPLAGLQIDRLRGDCHAVDGQCDLHVAPRTAAFVADGGHEHRRCLQVGHAVAELEIGDPGVLHVLGRHLHDLHRAGQLLPLLAQRLGRPRCSLPVGQQHQLLRRHASGKRRQASRARSMVCRGGGRPIHRLDRGQGLQRVLRRVIGIVAEGGCRAADRQHRNPAPPRQFLDDLPALRLGVVQQRAVELLVAHAEAVVDQQARHALADRGWSRPRFRAGEVRPGHRQAEQQQAQRPQRHQQQLAPLEDAPAAQHGFAEEVHRRPLHHAKPPPVQQVDHHRGGGSDQSGDGKPGGKEHGR